MKKSLKISIVTVILLFSKNNFAQFTFTVNPGINYNGATFGLKTGKWLPYIGITYLGGDAAGKVIQAFGEVVIGGNYAVGLVVFAILIRLSAVSVMLSP